MLHRLDVGAGPRLLLLHGNDLGGGWYRPFADALAAHGLATTLITLPGFAGMPPLPSPSWSALTDLVVDEVLARDDVVAVAGHSLGGLLAVLVAARLGPRLGRLALLEPAIFPGRTLATLAARRYRRVVVDARRDRFENHNGGMRRLARPADVDAAFVEGWLAARSVADVATGRVLFATLPELYPLPFRDVSAETLLVTGAHTGLFGRLIARHVTTSLPRPLRRVVVDAAHWLIPEALPAVADAVAAFVDGR